MTTASVAQPSSSADHPWRDRARYFHSGNAFALKLSTIPSVQFSAERAQAFDPDTPTGLIAMDLSEQLETAFAATTPLVLSRYARIRAGESLEVQVRASAQLYYVIKGQGTTRCGDEHCLWQSGDVLAFPGAARVDHQASEESVLWLVTDEPSLYFLDLEPPSPTNSKIAPIHYPGSELQARLDAVYRHPDADSFPGYAVVLSHQDLEATRNIHQTMTLALNSLPSKRAQRPHRHNSMALTLCVQGERCYSMIDGQRKDWLPDCVMLTPPGAVHSHHNDGDRRMECFIVQDGGLYYFARTIGFDFVD